MMESNELKISMKAARVNANLSQQYVAKYLGIDKSTLINWEKGRSSPSINHFAELCKLYKISQNNIILPNILQKVE